MAQSGHLAELIQATKELALDSNEKLASRERIDITSIYLQYDKELGAISDDLLYKLLVRGKMVKESLNELKKEGYVIGIVLGFPVRLKNLKSNDLTAARLYCCVSIHLYHQIEKYQRGDELSLQPETTLVKFEFSGLPIPPMLAGLKVNGERFSEEDQLMMEKLLSVYASGYHFIVRYFFKTKKYKEATLSILAVCAGKYLHHLRSNKLLVDPISFSDFMNLSDLKNDLMKPFSYILEQNVVDMNLQKLTDYLDEMGSDLFFYDRKSLFRERFIIMKELADLIMAPRKSPYSDELPAQ